MTNKQIQDIVIETIAEEVIERVNEKLLKVQKHALVVCTGSALAFQDWINSLKLLQQDGFSFDLFLSQNAEQVLDFDKIKQQIKFKKIWNETEISLTEQMAANYHTVIVPALTVNTASKIAACNADTPASRIIFNALMKGKSVVVSTNGCCPDNQERIKLGYNMAEPLKEMLRENIACLRDFGATLAVADTLYQRTLVALERKSLSGLPKASANTKSSKHIKKRIITRQDLVSLSNGTSITVPKNCQITCLAADSARELGITIIYK